MKYYVKVRGKKIEVERLDNGKFRVPSISKFINIGVGSVNFDDARIPIDRNIERNYDKENSSGKTGSNKGLFTMGEDQPRCDDWLDKGRFPANLICSDDVLNDGTTTKSKESHNIKGAGFVANSQIFHNDPKYEVKEDCLRSIGDSGSFSRYFSLDAWWSERIKELPKEIQKTFPFLIIPKPSKSEKNKGLQDFNKQKVNDGRKTPIDNAFQRGETERHNIHPTVKSVALFSYLITLGSRRGDVIFDPFMGSGTAGIASYSLGRSFIGFELDPDYFKIGNHRIVDELKNKKLEAYI